MSKLMISMPFILIIATATTLFALSSADKQAYFYYKSAGNDLADIQLTLYVNGKFELTFKDFDNNSSKTWKGRWKEVGEYFNLKFNLFSNVELETLFPKNKPGSNIVIKNKKTFLINKEKEAIWIWGIYCEKQAD